MINIDVAVSHLDDREKEVLQQGKRLRGNKHTCTENDQPDCKVTYTLVPTRGHHCTTKEQQAHNIHTRLKTCQKTIERNLKRWNEQQILAEKQKILK